MNRALQILREQVGSFGDALSDLTGYAAIRVPLQTASQPNEVTLAFTGYRQIDSFSCGAVASCMVARFLRPEISFERVYAAVDPCRKTGAGVMRVARALRSLGVTVTRRTSLTFEDVCDSIDAGSPVLVRIKTSDPRTTHWIAVYGYGRRPNLLFIAGQGLPFFSQQRAKWSDFRHQWVPEGEGMLCRKTRRPRRAVRPVRKNKSPSG